MRHEPNRTSGPPIAPVVITCRSNKWTISTRGDTLQRTLATVGRRTREDFSILAREDFPILALEDFSILAIDRLSPHHGMNG